VWTEAGELFTFGNGTQGQLGHGEEEDELVPMLVEAMAVKLVIGASAGEQHLSAWTDAGELFTFGCGLWGQLGHGGVENEAASELVPRLFEALAGKKVIGASVCYSHTAVWTEAGELFTFGDGSLGQLGHGEVLGNERVPRLVAALVEKRVIGASAGDFHTVAWTQAGQAFTFGAGAMGALGHGVTQDEHVPRLVTALIAA